MKPARAKLFQNGGSQAVRLPRQCRFPDGETEVVVTRIGRKVILEPLNDWPESFLDSLGALTETVERPKRVAVSKLRDPFE
jgi:antitoxin VapB